MSEQAVIKLGDASHLLTHKRTKSRRTNNTTKTRPAFVTKLWSMVNDPANQEHIRWNGSGDAFQVVGREPFERAVLPRYFKHSNFASFVRQLNMYGWHKVQDVNSGTMQQSGDELWQFKSPDFVRGREDLLDNIVRNKHGKGGSDDEAEGLDMHRVLNELSQIRNNQNILTEELRRVQKTNDILWRENVESRERHVKHAEALERIMRFLATLYGGNSKLLSDLLNTGRVSGQKLLTSVGQVSEMMGDTVEPLANGNGYFANVDPSSPARKQRRIESISSTDGSNNMALVRSPGPTYQQVRNNSQLYDGQSKPVVVSPSSLVDSPINTTTNASTPVSVQGTVTPLIDTTTLTTDVPSGHSLGQHQLVSSPSDLFPELKEPVNGSTDQLNDISKHIDSQGVSIHQLEQLIHQNEPDYNTNDHSDGYDSWDAFINPNLTYDEASPSTIPATTMVPPGSVHITAPSFSAVSTEGVPSNFGTTAPTTLSNQAPAPQSLADSTLPTTTRAGVKRRRA